jgi:hypothetical protein
VSITATALLNGLLGASFGVWFRFQVLIPLIAVAFVEVAFLKHTGMGSVLWSAIVLITALEIGYLIGSSLGTLWRHAGRERVLRDFTHARPR